MKWGTPEWLWMLPLVPTIGILLCGLGRKKRQALSRLTSQERIPDLAIHFHPERHVRALWIWLAAMALLLLALARPQWGESWKNIRHRSLDIMVALDTSKSMLAQDLKPDRLQQAKWGVRDLVERLRGDRIGLIPFAGTSFLQCPLTIDYAAFLMSLNDIYVGIIPHGGTAITTTLKTAIENFNEENSADRIILLITDGEDNEGDPLTLIPQLKDKGIRVFAIGVGSEAGDLIPAKTKDGQSTFLKDREGNVVKTVLQEEILEELTVQTDGLYVRAIGGNLGIDTIVEKGLANLQRNESESRRVKTYADRYGWFVGLAIILMSLEVATLRGPFLLRKGKA